MISQEYKDLEKDLMLGREGQSGSGILDKSPQKLLLWLLRLPRRLLTINIMDEQPTIV